MKKTLSVVGGGFGGLCSACYLAAAGHDVTLFEKNESLGGRARAWNVDGFSFDLGPSWYLMPEVFERFFGDFSRRREDYYTLNRLNPYYRIFFGGHETVDVTDDLEQTRALFERFEPGGAERLDAYLKQAEYKYTVAMEEFLYREYRSFRDFLNRRLLIEGTRLGVFRKLDRFVGRYFSDHRARKILEYAMVFLGTSPTDAPALYSIMSHVDLNLGVWFPRGGMISLVRALERLAGELGVTIRCNTPIRGFDFRDRRIRALRTDSGDEPTDGVLVNADYAHSELDLMPDEGRSYGERYWKSRTLAPSFFVVYLGLTRKLRSLVHHNLYFADDWERHFDSIFRTPGWPDYPSYYVSCASYDDPTVAPQGKENVFILVPVAAGLDDSTEFREQYAEKLIEHFESITGETIRDSIAVKRLYSQRDFADDYNAYRGTALGLAHTLFQTAVFRPSQRSRKVDNLYYAGQYTHPGVGVPMTFISSRVIARSMAEELS